MVKYLMVGVLAGLLVCSGDAAEIDQTAETLKVSLTPAQPFILHDGTSAIAVKSESVYFGRGGHSGTVQVHTGDSVLTMVPGMVVYAGAHRYDFRSTPEFVFGHVRESDMVMTVVERCNLTVRSSKRPAAPLALKKLDEEIEILCKHGQIHNDIYTVKGEGGHFIKLKPSRASISRFHPDPELGAKLTLDLITNFGVESITLAYKKKMIVTLGPETITLQSSGFDYKSKTMKLKVLSESSKDKAVPVILKYGE